MNRGKPEESPSRNAQQREDRRQTAADNQGDRDRQAHAARQPWVVRSRPVGARVRAADSSTGNSATGSPVDTDVSTAGARPGDTYESSTVFPRPDCPAWRPTTVIMRR